MKDRHASGVPVAEFWDRNPHVSEDPAFWMAHTLCRQAINRRVSGAEDGWPLDFLYARAGSPRFGRMLSLGCGMGRLERSIRTLGIAESVDAIDASAVSIGIAKKRASEKGITEISYSVADLNRVSLPKRHYDAIVFHQSLHHVEAVERLLGIVRDALRPGGFLFLEEWAGPSRTEWTPARMERLRALFGRIPPEWRKWPELRPPIEEQDPTEAVRSSAIRPGLRRLFRTVIDRPYGGQIVSVLLPQLERERIPPPDLDALISQWLDLESAEMDADPDSSFYNAILATPRTGLRGAAAAISNTRARASWALRAAFRGSRHS